MPENTSQRQILFSVLAVMGAMLSIGFGASLAKTLFSSVGPLGTAAYRITTGAMILLIWFRPWRWVTSRADWQRILPYGAMLAMMNLLFYAALDTLPVGVAIAIEFTGPLALAIFSSRRAVDFLWAALAVLGLLLLTPVLSADQPLDPTGVVLALGAGAFWAAYIVLGRRASHLRAGQVTGLGMTAAAAMALPFGIAQAGAELLNPSLLATGLFVGLLSSAIPYTLEMHALRYLPTKTFGVTVSVEPMFGAIAGAIILSETLSLAQILAIGCIMAASAGCTATAMRQAKRS
ncbi:EamA family transporter [Orrella daihaiensis]|uniref:DMT family transporter n=1 Tax=Orrella daihaiensis TaxID=2782176 RepID=A0ABY4AM72_9BURK|nr:DMT family transporter [Orrella daihaiensis]UOD51143.1 DMT family transporter [Orrella daihaiensis]